MKKCEKEISYYIYKFTSQIDSASHTGDDFGCTTRKTLLVLRSTTTTKATANKKLREKHTAKYSNKINEGEHTTKF